MCGPAFNVSLEFALTDTHVNVQAIISFKCLYLLFFLRTTLRSSNGQVLSPEDIVMAGVLDNPSGLDFSAATYPVSNLPGPCLACPQPSSTQENLVLFSHKFHTQCQTDILPNSYTF